MATFALQVFSVGNIICGAHIIPDNSTRSKTGDGRNKGWMINSTIDMTTWNDFYN